MGLIKWVRRRLEAAASDNRKSSENKVEELSFEDFLRDYDMRLPTRAITDIRLPTRAIPAKKPKGKGKLFRRVRAKSATEINRVNIALPPLPRQTSYMNPIDLEDYLQTHEDDDYEVIPEAQYENFASFTPPRRLTTVTSKPALHPRSLLTRPQEKSNETGTIHSRRSHGRGHSKMISSQSSPIISNVTHGARAKSLERVLHERNIARGSQTQHTDLEDQHMMTRKRVERTQDKFRSSKSACDLYDDGAGSCAYKVSRNPRPEPAGCENSDMDTGNQTLIGEQSLQISLSHDSDTPVNCGNMFPRTPGWKFESDATTFDVLPYRDIKQQFTNCRQFPSKNLSASDEKSPIRCKNGLSISKECTALPRTPGCTMEFNSTLFDALPCDEIAKDYERLNPDLNYSSSSTESSDDEMSLSMMAETIRVLQSQLNKKKQLATEARHRRSSIQPL